MNIRQLAALACLLAAVPASALAQRVTDSVFAFAAPSVDVNENGPNVTLTITRTGAATVAASVYWATSNGSAVAGQDFGTLGSAVQRTGTISWAAGDTSSKTIAIGPTAVAGAYIPVINDTAVEGPESFTVTLTSASGATLGAQKTAQVNILSEERGVAMVSATANGLESAGTITVAVARSGPASGDVGVSYAFTNGTAVSGTHYTGIAGTLTWPDGDAAAKNIVVPIQDDGAVNANRTFTVTLSSAVGATLGAPAATVVTIRDDDNTVQFAAANTAVTEGTATLNLSVTRTGSAGGPAAVTWTTADGTALAGTDFGTAGVTTPRTGTINWAAGDSAPKMAAIPIINDTTVEGAKTFTVSLSSPSGATFGGITTATVSLNDNDAGAVLAQPAYAIAENGGNVVLTVNRVGPAAAAVNVMWTTANGTAISGTHFGMAGSAANRTGVLSWMAGNTAAKTITIPILNNAIADGDRVFNVVLTTTSPAFSIGTPGSAVVTINDDDILAQSQLAFDPVKVVVSENAGTAVLTVKRIDLGGGFGLPVTLSYATAPGTAVAPSDYTTKSGTVSWVGGDGTDKTITINIMNDAVAESPEQFKVNVTTMSPGVSIATPSATVLILDDDEAFPLDGVMPSGWAKPVDADAGWHVSNDPGAFEGAFSLGSDQIDDGQNARIEVTRNFAAGTITFRVKVSSEPGFDFLRFFVDGVQQGSWSGTTNTTWQAFSLPISAGTHTLRWSYEKDANVSSGSDAAWIDAVVLP